MGTTTTRHRSDQPLDLDRLLELASAAAEDLRARGDLEKAEAIATLVEPLRATLQGTRDLLTQTEGGTSAAVPGAVLREWARSEGATSFTVGGAFRLSKETVAGYVAAADKSLDLEPLSDEEAATLVDEDRHGR